MAGGVSIVIKSDSASMALKALAMKTGADMGQLVRVETGEFLKLLVRLTAPTRVNAKSAFIQGRNAIVGDLSRAVRPILPNFRDKKINKLVAAQDVTGWNAASRNFKGDLKNTQAVPFSAGLHTGRQNNRGRVPRWTKLVMFQVQQWQAYRDELLAREGILKAGWNPAFKAVGLKPARYVDRHGDKFGSVSEDKTPDKPSFTMTNKHAKSPGYDRVVRQALASREKALNTKLDRAIAGEAVNLGLAK